MPSNSVAIQGKFSTQAGLLRRLEKVGLAITVVSAAGGLGVAFAQANVEAPTTAAAPAADTLKPGSGFAAPGTTAQAGAPAENSQNPRAQVGRGTTYVSGRVVSQNDGKPLANVNVLLYSMDSQFGDAPGVTGPGGGIGAPPAAENFLKGAAPQPRYTKGLLQSTMNAQPLSTTNSLGNGTFILKAPGAGKYILTATTRWSRSFQVVDVPAGGLTKVEFKITRPNVEEMQVPDGKRQMDWKAIYMNQFQMEDPMNRLRKMLSRRVNINVHEASVLQAAQVLSKTSGIPIQLGDHPQHGERLTLDAQDVSVAQVLEAIARQADLMISPDDAVRQARGMPGNTVIKTPDGRILEMFTGAPQAFGLPAGGVLEPIRPPAATPPVVDLLPPPARAPAPGPKAAPPAADQIPPAAVEPGTPDPGLAAKPDEVLQEDQLADVEQKVAQQRAFDAQAIADRRAAEAQDIANKRVAEAQDIEKAQAVLEADVANAQAARAQADANRQLVKEEPNIDQKAAEEEAIAKQRAAEERLRADQQALAQQLDQQKLDEARMMAAGMLPVQTPGVILKPWPIIEVNGQKTVDRGANDPWSDDWGIPPTVQAAYQRGYTPGAPNPVIAANQYDAVAVDQLGNLVGVPNPVIAANQYDAGIGAWMAAPPAGKLAAAPGITLTSIGDHLVIFAETGTSPQGAPGVWMALFRLDGDQLKLMSTSFHLLGGMGVPVGATNAPPIFSLTAPIPGTIPLPGPGVGGPDAGVGLPGAAPDATPPAAPAPTKRSAGSAKF